MPRRLSWAMLFALALSVSFAATLLPTIDYPIGTAFDEHGKLGAVRTGNYHYYHPLLIIDLGQAAAFVVQPPDLPSLAHLVRMLGHPRDVLRLRAVVARPCSWGHRGDCRAARCHSCAVDVVADQLCRCRSALDRFVDRGGEWRARGVRSRRRLPGNARTPWVRLTSDQGPCGHRSHVESRSRSLRLLSAAQRLCRSILPPSPLAA